MFTDFFAADDLAAPARRTGFVTRASKSTGHLFLALVPCGSWSGAQTTLAPLAAQVPQVVEPGAVSPAALHQRLNKRALVLLQDLLGQALATVHAREKGGADGLFPAWTKGSLAARTGVGLPESVSALLPGSGGRATQAGATRQAVWDENSSVCGQGALTPWNIPEQKYVATVGALAQPGVWFSFD
jgi:hypothetical protein